jgi:prephenate dehydrogenase
MAKITIIGTGLIGTSLGLALKQSQLKDIELVGTDAEHSARSGAQKKGAFDRVENRLISAIQGADIVILATPVMAMKGLMELMGPELPEGCLVTDVGSSKKVVLDWAEQYLPRTINFVGGHPMAGKETPGPESAEAHLFRDKVYCVIPGPHAQRESVSELITLIEAIGARPLFISVDEHDSFVAAVSHLPFLLSVALVGCTSRSPNWDDIAQLAATGYRDISRLASGDPVMHRDICLSNSRPIVAWIDAFIRELYQMRQILDEGKDVDGEAIKGVFDQANDARARWLAGQVNPQARQYSPHNELPTVAESMGELFVGRRMMQARKRLLGQWRDSGRKGKSKGGTEPPWNR